MRDLINRQDAINAILEDKIDDNTLNIMALLGDKEQALTLNETCDRHIQLLRELPANVRENVKGEWELCEDADGEYGVCSVCGIDADFSHYGKAYNFCPNCGASMT